MDSPKSKGMLLGKVIVTASDFFVLDTELNLSNGDGLYIVKDGNEIGGMYINRFEGQKIFKEKSLKIPVGSEVYRNLDAVFIKSVNRNDEKRKISANLIINETEAGIKIRLDAGDEFVFENGIKMGNEPAANPEKMYEILTKQFRKSGNSVFEINEVKIEMETVPFIPVSDLNEIRRKFYELAETEIVKTHPFQKRKKPVSKVKYYKDKLDYRGNVVNSLSRKFYTDRGVKNIDEGLEISSVSNNTVLMTCKYCIKKELNICPVDAGANKIKLNEPLYLENEYGKFQLKFNCADCEMQVIKAL
jgi:putative protease